MTHDWLQHFDPTVGLWWATKAPAHTAPLAHLGMKVHPGPDAVSRFILAAERGELAQLPVETVLRALAKMKSADNPGHLCWYWEDGDHSSDANASFFTGIGLIALWLGYREELSTDARELLLSIFEPLLPWFSAKIEEELCHCLNGYMGEAACAWLLAEILERREARAALTPHLLRAADDWLKRGFGFGEHLSDVYSRVALQQVSLLLLFARELPADLRTRYEQVFHALLAINDSFDGKPYVPAMRCYDFLESPSKGKNRNFITGTYRDRIVPAGEIEETEIGNNPPLEGLLFKAGWHGLAPAKKAAASALEAPCYSGSVARARIEEDIRLGSLSHFPVMPEVEFQVWGMSWQSFPVAFWRPEGDWGYLQWEQEQEEGSFCHPSEGPSSDPLKRGNPLTRTLPPIVGKTFSLQRGGDLIVLRIMPMIDLRWLRLKDRLRLVHGTTTPVETASTNGWNQLLLHYPERCVSVHHINLMPQENRPALVAGKHPHTVDWECVYPLEKLNWILVSLWAISLNGPIQSPPHLENLRPESSVPRHPQEYPRLLLWDWETTCWKVKIDPLGAAPLEALS